MDWNSKLNAGCLCLNRKLVPWGHSKWIFWEKTCCWLVLMYSGNSLVLYYQFCCKKCPFKLCLVYVRSCRQNIETMWWWVSCQKGDKQNSEHYTSIRLVIYTIEFASEFCVEFACRILLSKITNEVLESRRNLKIESEFQRKFDNRWPTLLWLRWLSST